MANFLETIKLLWKNRSKIKPAVEAAKQMGQLKVEKGIKTTEFFMTAIANAIIVVQALNGVLDPKTATVLLAGLNGLYAVLRTLLKAVAEIAEALKK